MSSIGDMKEWHGLRRNQFDKIVTVQTTDDVETAVNAIGSAFLVGENTQFISGMLDHLNDVLFDWFEVNYDKPARMAFVMNAWPHYHLYEFATIVKVFAMMAQKLTRIYWGLVEEGNRAADPSRLKEMVAQSENKEFMFSAEFGHELDEEGVRVSAPRRVLQA